MSTILFRHPLLEGNSPEGAWSSYFATIAVLYCALLSLAPQAFWGKAEERKALQIPECQGHCLLWGQPSLTASLTCHVLAESGFLICRPERELSSHAVMHMRSANMISTEYKCVIKTTAGIFLVIVTFRGLKSFVVLWVDASTQLD